VEGGAPVAGGMSALRQLPLPFAHAPDFAGAAFLNAPSNEAALAWLQPGADWPQRRLALWGPEGSGKTHLLHVWAARVGARLLPGPGLRFSGLVTELHGDAAHGVEWHGDAAPGHLAIDDADAAPERDLLHVLNAAHEGGLHVLMASRTPPARWPTALPDLASRLRATASVELLAPDDELLRSLLARLLAERQLAVPEALQDWLLLRLPRTSAVLRESAARLDRLALASGGPVTRALAAEVLAELGDRNRIETDEDLTPDPAATSPPAPRLL
jgi:chromosomal replication initiation ATPase DnaA